MGGLTDMISGAGARKARTQARVAADAADKRAMIAQAAQESAQARASIAEDKRAQELSSQNASLMRLAAARRAGRNSLSFMPVNGLKTKLGG